MAIQKQEGPLVLSPDKDFIRTYGDITWGIKIRNIADFAIIMVIAVQNNTTKEWELVYTVDDALDLHINNYPTVLDFLKSLVSKIQAWLDLTFNGGPKPAQTPFEELDSLLQSRLKVTKQSDGKVVAQII